MLNVSWLYVAAIYAAAIWLARRARVEIPWKIAALFYALVFVYMFQPLTRDVVNLPVDFLETMPPWVYTGHTVQAANRDLNDLVLQLTPWAHQVREAWKSGHVPLWNAMSGSGYPLLANAQSAALSPLRILSLPLPLGFAMSAEAAWKLLIALTCTWLFCRRRGYSEFASAAGAIAFAFSSFMIVWLHFPLITSAALLPAVLLAVDMLAERVTYGRFVFGAAAWTAMLFGGHPETASHTLFIAVLMTLWILFAEKRFATWRERFRFLLTLGGAMFVAALLAAPYLAPLAEAITRSRRYHELQVAPNAIGYYSDWYSTMAWLQPRFYGDLPLEGAWGPATAESITGFAGILGIVAWFALAAWVVRTRNWRSREAFFVIATLLVLSLVFAWPGISELFHVVFKLAANARLRLLICLLASFQIAAVVNLIERGARREVLFGLIAAAGLLFVMMTTDFPNDWMRQGALLSMIPSLLVIAATAVAVMLVRFRREALFVVLALTIAELWTATAGWNPVLPSALMYPQSPMITELQRLRDATPEHDDFRIVGFGAVLFPNISAIYGFEDIRAHDPMANGRYLGQMRVLANYDTNDYFGKWTSSETPLIDYLNVRYLLTPPQAGLPDSEGRLELVYDGKDGRIFRNNAALPRWFSTPVVLLEFRNDEFVRRVKGNTNWGLTSVLAYLEVNQEIGRDLLSPRPADAPLATVKIRRSEPTHWEMTVNAPRHSMVVSSIPHWPGWKVFAGGKQLDALRVNGAFLGFIAPPGVTDVRVSYDPITFKAGAWIAGLTVLALMFAPRLWRRFHA